MKDKIIGNKLSVFEIIKNTYLMLFFNFIPIFVICLSYFILINYIKISYIFLIPLSYIFITLSLEYKYSSSIKIGFNIIVSYFILFLFISTKIIGGSVISILATSTLIRKTNFFNNLIIIQEIFKKNFLKIFISSFINYIINSVIIGIVLSIYFIYNNKIYLNPEEISNLVLSYKEYIFLSMLVVYSISNYIMYKNFEKNDIIKGE